ncbi:MAG: polyphosphate polymerase domain-containing protein [Bacilli bacterium]
MITKVFNRVEKKYLLTKFNYDLLLKKLGNNIIEDRYGLMTISNLYYDTNSFELIRNSIEKPQFKEKLRLRTYNLDYKDKEVYIELKKKYKGIVYKRRESYFLDEAYDFLNKKIVPKKNNQVTKEIDFFINNYNVKPVLFLAYDRVAYYGKDDSEFRVTFDTNIRSRVENLNLENGDYGNLYFKDDTYLMEVKCLGAMPLFFVHILNELNIFPTSFSKYGNIYKDGLFKEVY